MRPSSGVALCGAQVRASCIAAIVATMKLPPTSSAASAMLAPERLAIGSATPSAIAAWHSAHSRWRGQPAAKRLDNSVDAAAASPNSGQARPNQRASSTSARAITGRKVAGRM